MISREELLGAILLCFGIAGAIIIGVPIWCVMAGIGTYAALTYFQI